MMNNPALFANQNPYGYGNPLVQGQLANASPIDQSQSPFQPGSGPNQFQRPGAQSQLAAQQLYQQQLQQYANAQRPESRGGLNLGQVPSHTPSPNPNNQATGFVVAPSPNPQSQSRQSSSTSQRPNSTSAISNPTMANNMMAQAQAMPNPTLAQQAQMQNAQAARIAPQATAQQPQVTARERARVSVLLEINTHLLQEVVSLQAQGKAGNTQTQGQQSPTSPSSATDPSKMLNNSPVENAKASGNKPASQEYADCMRRLQANLSYLAAIADAKKKVNGTVPSGPAIMIPPPHLTQVHDLYKKLNALFPEASQSAINKAVAFAAGQNSKSTNPMAT